MKTIASSVGRASRNNLDDVFSIQQLLNNVSVADGGPAPSLVLDGLCGPKTQHAIQTFQLHHFGFRGADGRVEPGKQTLARLNEINDRQNPVPPPAVRTVPEVFASFVFRQPGKPGTIMNSNADFFSRDGFRTRHGTQGGAIILAWSAPRVSPRG